ncbi:hypothetical protein SAY86_023647 [Trapa natans]|uniref:X8 domain-containing protein n=1 Tax=Trapa natans TaxID=22666 RepID=A0AAN7LVA5_TRANT|nr:hypothetical protein SAY86_023647 [Trapa natans]
MVVGVCLVVLLLALTGYSSATYCICKDEGSNQVLQKTIDYACGSGADCSAILQNGVCYQPNTVKDHCNYAVNSYFQRKGQAAGTCDFSGTATTSATIPTQTSGCVYPTSPSSAGTSTTSTNTTSSTNSQAPTSITDSSPSGGLCRGLSLTFLAFSGLLLL